MLQLAQKLNVVYNDIPVGVFVRYVDTCDFTNVECTDTNRESGDGIFPISGTISL